MTDRSTIARIATRAAYQARRTLSLPRDRPVNAFDITEALGVEVRFIDASSLEGMFSRAPHPVVILPSQSHRPRGRLAFTCVHELGHCLLGHGDRVDELIESPRSSDDPDEYAANTFASTILMPRPVVEACLQRRGLTANTLNPITLFGVACELGVGLRSLVTQINFGLGMCDAGWARDMERVTPKLVRESLVVDSSQPLTLIDEGFASDTIDLEVGETLLVTHNAPFDAGSDSGILVAVDGVAKENHSAWKATSPGTASAKFNGRGLRVRTARSGYVGPQRNRFLPDPEAK